MNREIYCLTGQNFHFEEKIFVLCVKSGLYIGISPFRKEFIMKISACIRRISKSLPAVRCVLTPKRTGVAVAALFFTLGTACIPASSPPLPEDNGERFGEIHWYEAETAPASAGAVDGGFLESAYSSMSLTAITQSSAVGFWGII